jgi:endonuclease/exonuclease/phosphatase family metal-dependent hydrolase
LFTIYHLLLLGSLGVGFLLGDRTWYLASVNACRYWLLLIAMLDWINFLMLDSTEMNKLRVLALFVATGLFIGWYVWYPFLRSPQGTSVENKIQVMTFNVFKDNSTQDRIVSLIESQDPDIVALQEVTAGHADYLRRNLADAYPHSVWTHEDLLTLSKYPVLDQIVIEPEHAHLLNISLGQAGNINFVNVHAPSPNPDDMLGKTGNILAAFRGTNKLTEEVLAQMYASDWSLERTIWVGDFNATEGNELYSMITRKGGLADAYRVLHPIWPIRSFTFPASLIDIIGKPKSFLPLLRLDYIFVGRDMATLDSDIVPDNAGSDHHPVTAVVGLHP